MNQTKKRILFICSTLNAGGAQKIISNITANLPKEYEADILLNTSEDIEYEYKGNIISLDMPFPENRDSIYYQGRVFLKRLKLIKIIKKERKYIAVVSILTSANVANIIRKSKGTKSVIIEVNLQSESKTFIYRFILGHLIKRFYNRADAIVVETDMVKESLVSNHGINPDLITVIPNAVDIESIRKNAERPIDDDERMFFDREKTFITAGRLVPQKAQWHLIRAFSELVKEHDQARLAIFGDGVLLDTLKGLVRDYGLEDKIRFFGFTTELDKYVSKSLAFVMPSMYEGMPIAMIQALAVGTPCIATDFYSGSRDLLGDETTPQEKIDDIFKTKWGIITPLCSGVIKGKEQPLEKEEVLLANAMKEIASDSKLREYYREASMLRSAQFDINELINKWMGVIA